ncbi:MAG TPA: ABC transporter [Actinobacteria bacterium]|nr:ABC transporter [Actinomycetota bacterium]HCK78559.1 ABC transporter [Actinomycetota bacterium]
MTSPSVSAEPTRARRPLWGWAFHDGWIVALRDLRKLPRVPEIWFFALIQPVIFVLLFAFVFGGAIPVEGGSYREFLMAGIFAQTIGFNSANTTVGLADDLTKGILDRFRSLPMSSSAVVLGRTTSDIVRGLITLIVLIFTGLAVGWRIHNGLPKAVLAVALLLFFGFALSWIAAWIGLYMPNTEVANTAGLIWLFPLTFLSNSFVPLDTYPAWLQTIAEWNPLSSVVLAMRQLFGNPVGPPVGGFPQTQPFAYSLLACVVILLVFVPLAVRKYRRSSAR